MNKKMIKKYLKTPHCCPNCSSEAIIDGEFDYNWEKITSSVRCNTCGFAWTNVYPLTTIKD